MINDIIEDPVRDAVYKLAEKFKLNTEYTSEGDIFLMFGFAVDKNGKYYHLVSDILEFQGDFFEKFDILIDIKYILSVLRSKIATFYHTTTSDKERKELLNFEAINYYEILVEHFIVEF